MMEGSSLTNSIEAAVGLIRHRITKQDKNYMCVVVGETGSGKSAVAVEIARRVDPSFEGNPRIVFTPKDFMEWIPNMKKGQAIVFDEAGVGIPAREWQRVQNKLIGYVAQLFRHLNLCVIFTVPSMSFIDKQVKNLMHAVIETKTIDYENRLGVTKYWKIRHNAVFDKTRLEPLVIFSGSGHYTVDPVYVPMPPQIVWNKYVTMKESYANQFYKDTIIELNGEGVIIDGTKIRKLTNQSDAGISLMGSMLRDGVMTQKEMSERMGKSLRTIGLWYNDYKVKAARTL